MNQTHNLYADFGHDSQFFFELAAHGITRLFARFDFASGKLPLEGHRLMPSPLAGKDQVVFENQCGYDSFHGDRKTSGY
jgi:hypothetical protein